MVAMTPLIIIQLMGLMYNLKFKQAAGMEVITETIANLTPQEAKHITVFKEAFYG
jgi:hypothetical protein